MHERTLSDPVQVTELARRLDACPGVARFNRDEEEAGSVLAYSFQDIEESSVKLLTDLLPRLMAARDCTNIEDILLDIGLEFRHIIYHMYDPLYYRYIWPERTEALRELP